MLSSMTGFSSKTTTLSLPDGTKINTSISLKSLNSRFFEATCKLPHIATHLETDIIKILKQKLQRGHVYLTLHMKDSTLLKSSVKANMAAVKSYLESINNIKKTFALEGNVSINDIINLPNIFDIEEQEGSKTVDKQIIAIIKELTQKLIEAREKEGAALKKDLLKRISIMGKEIEAIEKSAETLMSLKKEEVATLIKKIEDETEDTTDLRKSSLLLMLDKLDINEEIVRFKSHLENLQSHIESSKGEVGKKTDFTLQEMAREINTIAAKCSNAKISSKAINVKVELEKAREQAQNIV